MRRILLSFALLFSVLLFCRLFLPDTEETLSSNERYLPVVMYHSVLKDPARAGTYIISPDTLKSDLQYLLDQGYETVLPSELVAFCAGTGNLPEKPVLITLDDGYLNNLTYVLPILAELDAKAVISVVGAFTDRFTDTPDPNPNYAHLTWDNLIELQDSGRVEIGNHTYNMHSQSGRQGCARRSGESLEDYQSTLLTDIGRLQSAFLDRGIDCDTFTYPFGRISSEAREVLKGLGFRVTLTCYEQINVIAQGEPDSLYGLGRFNRPSGDNSAAFFRRMLKGR